MYFLCYKSQEKKSSLRDEKMASLAMYAEKNGGTHAIWARHVCGVRVFSLCLGRFILRRGGMMRRLCFLGRL